MHESTLLDYCSVPHGPCWRVGNSLRELPCTRGASALPEPGGTP
jgi:hypothetical protein